MNLDLSCKRHWKSPKVGWLRLKQSKEPHIRGIWGLWVNRQVNKPREVSKEGPLVIFRFFSLSSANILTVKVFLEVTLVSLSLRVRTVFPNFGKTEAILLYWFAAQQQTSTPRSQKFDFIYAKLSAKLNELSFKL